MKEHLGVLQSTFRNPKKNLKENQRKTNIPIYRGKRKRITVDFSLEKHANK